VEGLTPNLTPVNSFRLVVVDTYFDTDLGKLENRVFFALWEKPYGFIEVNDNLDSCCSFNQ